MLVETRSRSNRRALESTDPAWMLALRAQVLEVPVEAWHTFDRPKSSCVQANQERHRNSSLAARNYRVVAIPLRH